MAKMMAILAAASVFCVFLQLCGAVEHLNCTVTQDGEQTTYHVPQKFPASTDSSWSNGTDHVLATQGSHKPPVVSSSVDTLVISGCMDTILFLANSHSPIRDYKATCTTNCTGAALPQVPDTDPWITARVWMPILIVILVLAGLGFMCYIFRDGIRRRCCCSQTGGFYTAGVKMNNPGPPVVVVEARNK